VLAFDTHNISTDMLIKIKAEVFWHIGTYLSSNFSILFFIYIKEVKNKTEQAAMTSDQELYDKKKIF
jgi:predicted metal-dependent peptidase